MANLVVPPYDIYADANGDPLEDGYVYIGIAGLSPINNPLQAYWDAALSIPANNIRTKGGYPSNSGTPGRLYTATNYSILVQDKRNVTVYQQLDSVDYVNAASGNLISLVDTIADLRGLALAGPNEQASVGGSVTVGDGLMGPLYYWNATSPAVDNGVSVIKPTSTVGNGRWLWINTNAPMETVNISSSSTLALNFLNRLFLVDTALATTLTVPDGDFQGQNIEIANRGVSTLDLLGTGLTAGVNISESASLTWLGTQWSISYRGDLYVAGDLTTTGNIIVEGTVKWKHYYKNVSSPTYQTLFNALTSWVPNVGDRIACHGQSKGGVIATTVGCIDYIFKFSSTVINLNYADAAGQAIVSVDSTDNVTVVATSIEMMSNFDTL